MNENLRPCLGKRERTGAANAAGSAGDQGGFACENGHDELL
jgi:hypothetical protein